MNIICEQSPIAISGGKISKLRNLLGAAVLLPCVGKKPIVSEWQRFTLDTMRDEAYLRRLERMTNIGVLLGKASDGLCVLDFDKVGEDEKFLALNPALRKTLRTRGRRGSSFWVRISGDVPPSAKYRCDGEEVGEWRADGNQSIISGLHPDTGKPYQIVHEAHPAKIAFEKIVWPRDYSGLWREKQAARLKKQKQLPTERPPVAVPDNVSFSEEEIVMRCICHNVRTSHDKLFRLARGVKTLERCGGVKFNNCDFRRFFDKWYSLSRRYLRSGRREEYYDEFLAAYDCALYALDENAAEIAWQTAQQSPYPACADRFKSEQSKNLIRYCAALQKLVGNQPFFIASRDAGTRLGISHTLAASLLNALVRKNILVVVTKATTSRATRYRFRPAIVPEEMPIVVEQPRITFPDFKN